MSTQKPETTINWQAPDIETAGRQLEDALPRVLETVEELERAKAVARDALDFMFSV